MFVRSQRTWYVTTLLYSNTLMCSDVQLNGLKIFIACLKLVSHVELEDDERSYPAVVSAIQAAQTICQVLWRELECASPVRDFQLFLIAHQLLHCLVQLGIGDEYQELFRYVRLVL